MTTKYMKFEVSIHGLDAPDLEVAANYLRGWIKGSTFAGLHGSDRDLFNARRNEFSNDIEVELVESAGENNHERTS